MSRNWTPFQSQRSSLRSRVTPGVSWTTAWRDSVRRLISVDLPTFGKPTIATVPAMLSGLPASPDSLRALQALRAVGLVAHAGGVAWRGRPLACTSTSQVCSSFSLAAISAEPSR